MERKFFLVSSHISSAVVECLFPLPVHPSYLAMLGAIVHWKSGEPEAVVDSFDLATCLLNLKLSSLISETRGELFFLWGDQRGFMSGPWHLWLRE